MPGQLIFIPSSIELTSGGSIRIRLINVILQVKQALNKKFHYI
jgi:hypothetical protein